MFDKILFDRNKAVLDAYAESGDSSVLQQLSDGYHSFGVLYTHRYALFIAVCKKAAYNGNIVFRTQKRSDGTSYDNYFILGLESEPQKQIGYHLPMWLWNECDFATTIDCYPNFDGHTSDDVLLRLLAHEYIDLPLTGVTTVQKGATYQMPIYAVTSEGLKVKGAKALRFVKGNKVDESVFRQSGVITIDLLNVAKAYLSDVNVGNLWNIETVQAIDYITKAIDILEARQKDRISRNVKDTYQK